MLGKPAGQRAVRILVARHRHKRPVAAIGIKTTDGMAVSGVRRWRRAFGRAVAGLAGFRVRRGPDVHAGELRCVQLRQSYTL